jgi:hypothetical protein
MTSCVLANMKDGFLLCTVPPSSMAAPALHSEGYFQLDESY